MFFEPSGEIRTVTKTKKIDLGEYFTGEYECMMCEYKSHLKKDMIHHLRKHPDKDFDVDDC